MLTVNDDLTNYMLAGGEPFVLEVQLVDSNGATLDIDDDAMMLTFFSQATRAIVTDYAGQPAQYEGERFQDGTGEFFRWTLDGRFSDGLIGKGLVMVELARRLQQGRKVIATGAVIIRPSASSVPSLSGGAVADEALRITVNPSAQAGMALVTSRRIVPFGGGTPSPGGQWGNVEW